MSRNRFLALVTFTLLVAAFLRIWQLAIYPPGPHYDEAAELLIARSIAFGGARFFPIVEAYQGREVLFYYMSVPFLALIQDSIFSLRILSVFCNLLTIALSVALGRAMFGGRRGFVVGIVIGVLMTLSFPMLWMSRQAFRSSALPLMQALALLLLWRGLKAPTVRRAALFLILGGSCAGAALYTYNASRLFPFWLLLGGIALFAFDRKHWRQRIKQGLFFFIPLTISAAPMAIYAIQRPDVFFGRLEEVTQSDQSVTLAQSIVLHLKMFFIDGDPYFRYNEPQRPYFTFPEGILLLLGIALAAYRMTRRKYPATECAAYFLALLSPLMSIPSVISVGGLPPSHMRSLGMVPLIFVLVAVGTEWCFDKLAKLEWAHRPIKKFNNSSLLIPLVIITLLVGGILVNALYTRWASRSELFYETDADLAAAAHWLVDQHVTDDKLVYVAARDKGHPTVMIEPVLPITWLGTDSLFRAPSGEEGLYIFPHSAPPPAEWLNWLAPGAVDNLPLAPDGQPAFQAFWISGDTPLPFPGSSRTLSNRYLSFAGLEAPAIASGDSGSFTMAWQVTAPPAFTDLTPLLTVEDQNGSLIYRGDMYMGGTESWRAGETLLQRMPVQIPPATPPGDYTLNIAWIERSTDSYVSYQDSSGAQGAVWAQIGTLTVTRPATFPDPATLPIDIPRESLAAQGVHLLGWNMLPETLRPGESLPLTLYWQASDSERPDFIFTALLRGENSDTVLWHGDPISPSYPASRWANGEVLGHKIPLVVPREQSAGSYQLMLQFSDSEIEIATINIEGVPRIFEPPSAASSLDLNFGDQIQLYSAEVEQLSETIRVQIVWQSLQTMTQDYKVFVHLVDANGTILAQTDAMPQANNYPTSLWLPNEYVIDDYELPAVSAAVTLRIGLYDPITGTRLPILNEFNETADNYFNLDLKPLF
jgi:4-amino-4-deoxy-L-arabinose transferase-like glycosyltransferase